MKIRVTKNRKILNAVECEYNGIKFRSRTERSIYITLLNKGIKAEYEQLRCTLWARNKFKVPYYDKVGKKGFKRVTSKPLAVHYTPDFIFEYEGIKVFLEVKGFKNDVTPYKIRLFRDWLEDYTNKNALKTCYAVVYSIANLNTLLEDLKTKKEELWNQD